MPGPVDDVEHAHGIAFGPVKDQIVPVHRQHPDGFHLRIACWIQDADLRLCHNLRKDLFYRIENAVGSSRVIACNVGVDARQVLLEDSRMTLDPQGFASLDAAFLTRSFQSGSSGANGPRRRSANR